MPALLEQINQNRTTLENADVVITNTHQTKVISPITTPDPLPHDPIRPDLSSQPQLTIKQGLEWDHVVLAEDFTSLLDENLKLHSFEVH